MHWRWKCVYWTTWRVSMFFVSCQPCAMQQYGAISIVKVFCVDCRNLFLESIHRNVHNMHRTLNMIKFSLEVLFKCNLGAHSSKRISAVPVPGASEITANLYCNCVHLIGKVARFAVYICGNIWNAQYKIQLSDWREIRAHLNIVKIKFYSSLYSSFGRSVVTLSNLPYDTVCPGSSDLQKKY